MKFAIFFKKFYKNLNCNISAVATYFFSKFGAQLYYGTSKIV